MPNRLPAPSPTRCDFFFIFLYCLLFSHFSFFHFPNCIPNSLFFVKSIHHLAYSFFYCCTHILSFDVFYFSVCNHNYLITLTFNYFQNSNFFVITSLSCLLYSHIFFLNNWYVVYVNMIRSTHYLTNNHLNLYNIYKCKEKNSISTCAFVLIQ